MSTFRQEMPPKGGYDPIEWSKQVTKKRMPGKTFFVVSTLVTGGAWAYILYKNTIIRDYKLEMNDGRMALQPLLQVERERNLLRQLRKNRDEENELMKNVPGWEAGTLFGRPVYYNQAERYPYVAITDVYLHHKPSQLFKRIYEKHRH